MQWTFVKILQDNYVWLVNSGDGVIAIDCGDADPVYEYLKKNNLKLKYILITHAHDDHILGVDTLRELTGAKVVGNGEFADRLPMLDVVISGDQEITLLGAPIKIFNTPGHCADHVTYYFTESKLLFVGDFIFSLGCGRVFEGTSADMINSFAVLQTLPKDILVFPGHEYTKANLQFTKSLGFFNLQEREQWILDNEVTLPTTLEFELTCNPFLNVGNDDFAYRIMHLHHVDKVSFFEFLRAVKNGTTKLTGG